YHGQMKAVLARDAPAVPVIDLCADVPPHDARAAAYLLAAMAPPATPIYPAGTVFVCVVDPGVGGDRAALALRADGCWYVAPDNGLLEIVRRRAAQARMWRITWRPEWLSASFHGRDLFAPVAAMLALGKPPPGEPLAGVPGVGGDWPDDLAQVIYLDRFGNAMTGLRAATLAPEARLSANGRSLERVRTFSDVPPGTAFWYENANGLAEIAVNSGRADSLLGLAVGTPVEVV
ncbi:MAG: S-adenosyl-l-methionine hydroxide adenosyltransferase family protein, partial [Kiloniellales bacterium]